MQRLLLDPGFAGFGPGGSLSPDPGPEPIPAPESSPEPSADPSPTPADAGLGDPPPTPSPSPAPDQAQGWQSIREAAAAFGYQAPQEFGDDRAFLMHLLQQAQNNRQADFYARLGQQLAPHASGIQSYLQQQQSPAPPQRQPWEAPEFDERWLQLVERDQTTGLFVAKPGVPHEYAQKVNAFAEWKQQYDRNPAQVINGMVEQRAKDIAAQVVREQLQQQTQQQTIQQIVGQNSAWLYQRDGQGQPLIGLNGPMLTPVGARYMHHLQAVKGMGVADPRHQDTLAKQLVRAEVAAAGQQGQQGQQQQAASPQAQQATHAPAVNPFAAQPPAQRARNPAAPPEPTAGLSLRDMLKADLAAEGVTDSDFAAIGG